MITKIEPLFGLQKTKSNSNQLKPERKRNILYTWILRVRKPQTKMDPVTQCPQVREHWLTLFASLNSVGLIFPERLSPIGGGQDSTTASSRLMFPHSEHHLPSK